MSLAEEIKRVLTENPNLLVEVLTSRPEIIYQALAKLMPWQNLATKQDLEELRKVVATKDDLKNLATKDEIKNLVTKEELEAVRREMATKEDLKVLATRQELEAMRAEMATKKDIVSIRSEMATKAELEEIKKVMATKDDLNRLATKEEVEEIKKVMATKQDIEALRAEMATKRELEEIKKVMATKDDLSRLATKEELEEIKNVMATKAELEEIKKVMATKKDLTRTERKLMRHMNGLATRWGVWAEEAFRKGIIELLGEVGWKVDREVLFDKEGYVYGYPSDVEIDVVVRDGKVILIEITGTLKRYELGIIAKKKEFYEKVKGIKVSDLIVVTAYIAEKDEERVLNLAKTLGIKVISHERLENLK